MPSLVPFWKSSSSFYFLKGEDLFIRIDFEFRLEVFDSRLEGVEKTFLVMLKEVVLLMLFFEIDSLILRSSWSKLTLLFEEHSVDLGMGVECKVSRVLSLSSLLQDAKGEECGSSFLANFGEEEVDSNENNSYWDNAGNGGEGNEFLKLKLRMSFLWWS